MSEPITIEGKPPLHTETFTFPDDPNQVYWKYTQGTELRDPTMKEAADYYARLLSW